MKITGLDKILGRIEDLDTVNLSILVQRLARDRKLQETVFNTIQDGILVVDSESVVQYANKAAFDLIGLKKDAIGNTRLWKMVPELARTIDLDSEGNRVKTSPIFSREVELSYPEQRFVRLYIVPIDDQVGQDVHQLGLRRQQGDGVAHRGGHQHDQRECRHDQRAELQLEIIAG